MPIHSSGQGHLFSPDVPASLVVSRKWRELWSRLLIGEASHLWASNRLTTSSSSTRVTFLSLISFKNRSRSFLKAAFSLASFRVAPSVSLRASAAIPRRASRHSLSVSADSILARKPLTLSSDRRFFPVRQLLLSRLLSNTRFVCFGVSLVLSRA